MIRELIQRLWQEYLRYRDIISYLFWGVMTTAVNYAAYFGCTRLCGIGYFWSNIIAWVAGVAFGFVVNKVFVFRSLDWSPRTAFRECWQFVTARVLSGGLETGSLALFVDCFHCNDAIVKIVAGIVVVIMNYVLSRFVIFRKRQQYADIREGRAPGRRRKKEQAPAAPSGNDRAA